MVLVLRMELARLLPVLAKLGGTMCGQKAVGVKVVRCGARGATGDVQNVGPTCCLFVSLASDGKRSLTVHSR